MTGITGITAQKSHYPPGNQYAGSFGGCPVSGSWRPADHPYWWPDTLITNNESEGSSVPVVSRWLWPGNGTFLEVASVVVTWWRVAFLHSVCVPLFNCCYCQMRISKTCCNKLVVITIDKAFICNCILAPTSWGLRFRHIFCCLVQKH